MTTRSKLTKTLSDLTAFHTVTGNQSETRKLYDYVKKRLATLPLTFEETESNGFTSLCIYSANTAKPKVTLHAHIDVVTADQPQFKLARKNGRAYGRGVYDMKFAAACYIELFLALGDEVKDYDVAIMLTDDEELGGADGVKLLIDQGYRTDVAIIPDGGDNWHIEGKAKGAWEVRLICTGQAAHGSQPWKGDNAGEKLIKLVAELYKELPNNKDGITCNVTQLEAITSHNQIPGLASAAVDTRFQTFEELEKIQTVMYRLAEQYDASVELILSIDPVEVNLKHPLVAQFENAVEAVRGSREDPTMSYGASDGRFFHAEGMPIIIMRPEGGDAHGGAEWINEKSLEQYYEVLKQYVHAVARIDS